MSKFLGKLQFAQSRQSMKWENYSSNKPVRCVYSPRARDAIAAAAVVVVVFVASEYKRHSAFLPLSIDDAGD